MSKRRRWTPVKGTASRVYDARERLALAAFDLPGRLLLGLPSMLRRRRLAPHPSAIRDVLVLRLDRMGDLLMSLPALRDLRAALPAARIRLAVPAWSADLARSAPVDDVLVWSPPWAGRAREGVDAWPALLAKARALRRARPDLAVDLQGDVRAAMLLWLAGARERVGYANTGGAYFLTRVVPLDETVPWVAQNRLAVAAALGREAPPQPPADPLTAAERLAGRQALAGLGLDGRRPLVGIHPSGGRRIKQWDIARWSELARRLRDEYGAALVITGGAADRALAEPIARATGALDLTGRFGARETMAVIAALDLFLSPDTGPMHMACAVGTPSVSVFGPSDPARYFSGGPGTSGGRHVVVRAELWCSPCNLIRRPPAECAGADPPECLRLVGVDDVHREAARLLRDAGGYAPVARP